MRAPRTGDVYWERGIAITILDVSPTGRWFNIHCSMWREASFSLGTPAWEQTWDKQHPVGHVPDEWTLIAEPVSARPVQERSGAEAGALRAWSWPALQKPSLPDSTSPQS